MNSWHSINVSMLLLLLLLINIHWIIFFFHCLMQFNSLARAWVWNAGSWISLLGLVSLLRSANKRWWSTFPFHIILAKTAHFSQSLVFCKLNVFPVGSRLPIFNKFIIRSQEGGCDVAGTGPQTLAQLIFFLAGASLHLFVYFILASLNLPQRSWSRSCSPHSFFFFLMKGGWGEGTELELAWISCTSVPHVTNTSTHLILY